MPLLDVSDVLLDPMFAQRLHVIRRTQSVGSDGVVAFTETILNPVGVITAGSPSNLERAPDAQVSKGTITVHSTIALLDPTSGGDADAILWHGTQYVVKKSYDYSDYGNGFTMAECEITEAVGSPI